MQNSICMRKKLKYYFYDDFFQYNPVITLRSSNRNYGRTKQKNPSS
jgi:hypothetical protein